MSNTELPPLPRIVIEPIVETALFEDIGRQGDLTSDAVIDADKTARAQFVARQDGCVAGIDAARTALRLVDPTIKIAVALPDGSSVSSGETIAHIEGAARSLLTGERVALNFLGHLSGIATATQNIVNSVAGTHAKICCTRKTTPGLRALEKYAVRAGGGVNHRFGLDDGILIKDNHIAVAGSVTNAVEAARARSGHMTKIEIEVDTLEQLNEALSTQIDAVLLDNMSNDELREAVKIVDGRATTEASGRVTIDTAPAIAATGVDLISVGWITHSAPCLDIGLDF